MTGSDIRKMREALGLETFAFARILGVHVSTLYRWEQNPGTVTIDPLQNEILEQLAAKLRAKRAAEKKEIGDRVLAALLAGGALAALAFLLGVITGVSVQQSSAASPARNPERQKNELVPQVDE